MMSVDALELVREELTRPSSPGRSEAVRRLPLVAHALGEQDARGKLIPLLKRITDRNDDELVHDICVELGNLYAHVGGIEHVVLLVEVLETLAQKEETVVRDEAVNSLCKIMERSAKEAADPSIVIGNVFLPLLNRLHKKDQWFTSRVSSCALLSTLYTLSNSQQQQEIRNIFVVLCHDDTPMVKRAIAARTQELFEVVEKRQILERLLPAFNTLWQNETDSIRVFLLPGLLSLCKKCSEEENLAHTVSRLRAAADDKSWRVRLQLAKIIDQFATALGRSIFVFHLLGPYQNLLKDTEQEVRVNAMKALGGVCTLLDMDEICASVIPSISELYRDPMHLVRSECGAVVIELCKVLGPVKAEEYFMFIVGELLRDDHFEVKLTILRRGEDICRLAGIGPFSYVLLNALKMLISDAQWRVRLETMRLVPHLAEVFGLRTFESRLQPIFLSGLLDNVHEVREQAIQDIELIVKLFGREWTVSLFLSKILDIYNESLINPNIFSRTSQQQQQPLVSVPSPPAKTTESVNEKPRSYMTRITVLRTIPKLAAVLTTKDIERHVVPLLIQALQDGVPNVRFSSAQIAAWLVAKRYLERPVYDQRIASTLLRLVEDDADIDVRYICGKAIAECHSEA